MDIHGADRAEKQILGASSPPPGSCPHAIQSYPLSCSRGSCWFYVTQDKGSYSFIYFMWCLWNNLQSSPLHFSLHLLLCSWYTRCFVRLFQFLQSKYIVTYELWKLPVDWFSLTHWNRIKILLNYPCKAKLYYLHIFLKSQLERKNHLCEFYQVLQHF